MRTRERILAAVRHLVVVTGNGAVAIPNPFVGMTGRPAIALTPEIDPAGARFWIDNGAGAAVAWATDANFVVNVAGFATDFNIHVNITLPLLGASVTQTAYTIP